MTNTTPTGFTRRHALATAGAATLAFSLPGFAHTPGRKPNFLFIMADDLGWADLSCYGQQEYQTPVLDSLAAQGMRFTNGYSNSAVCSPTRMGLITGRYQQRLRAGLEEPIARGDFGLDPAHPTLPSLLKRQGYHTALIGKWHLGSLPKSGPLQSGYDEFWGNRGGGLDYFNHAYAGSEDVWDGDVTVDIAGYYTDLLADRSIDYLNERTAAADTPWLLSLHFTAPHWPWEANNAAGRAESERLGADDPNVNLPLFHHDGGSMETYAGMMTSLDANIGRVLAHLTELKLEQDTVVVFTSDNGGERFSNNWPFSGMKSELLEGGIRVPVIVRWPGLTAPGSISDSPVISMDFLPTFVAAAGGVPDAAFPADGVDIRPALAGTKLAERALFWRFHSKGQQAVRLGNYKYLKINDNEFLFDVIEDPRERANLKERQPAIFAQLSAAYADWNAQMVVPTDDVSTYNLEPAQIADHYDQPSIE